MNAKQEFDGDGLGGIAKACDEVGAALNEGKIGDIVAKHEKVIMEYYHDVRHQAGLSFNNALLFAKIGFGVLIGTLLYALFLEAIRRYNGAPGMGDNWFSETAAGVGVVSGIVIEFIASVAFFLYSRGARQFAAFHICLERTHRYLLAYKMADELKENRDETLRDLVCIMANAPMITREDMNGPPATVVTGPLQNRLQVPSNRGPHKSARQE